MYDCDLNKAYENLRGFVHRTPVLTSTRADALSGAKLLFKCENLQRAGAFKIRGAYNAFAHLTPDERARGVVTFSSGNHAQAIALAAKLWKSSATIVAPLDAPQIKIRATEGYGGKIVTYDRYKDDREAITRQLAKGKGLTIIPPFDHPHIVAGQGTAAMELLEEVSNLDFLVVPLGGGGLLSGSALAIRQHNLRCRVIGVEPEAGNDGQQSFRTGKRVKIPTPKTIADGAATPQIGELNFEIIKKLVDDIVTVSDQQLAETMRFIFTYMKLVVEPTGCLAAAAVLNKMIPNTMNKKVGIILSGGNIDPEKISQLL